MKIRGPLLDAQFEPRATDNDGTEEEGQVIYNTVDKKPKFFNGTNWLEMMGGSSGGGLTNYVSNPDAGTDATTGTSVTGTFARARGTTVATFSSSYFEVTTGTTAAGTMNWSLDTLNAKHNGATILLSLRVKSPTTSGTYKVGLYNSTDSVYVSGTELTLASNTTEHWRALFTLDTSKTYVVRFERTAGTTDETFYFDDVTVTPDVFQATETKPGIVSTIAQSFLGIKTFVSGLIPPLSAIGKLYLIPWSASYSSTGATAVSGTPTINTAFAGRIGNVVIGFIRITATASGNDVNVTIPITPPVAVTPAASNSIIGGVNTLVLDTNVYFNGSIDADTSNNLLRYRFRGSHTSSSRTYTAWFIYEVAS